MNIVKKIIMMILILMIERKAKIKIKLLKETQEVSKNKLNQNNKIIKQVETKEQEGKKVARKRI